MRQHIANWPIGIANSAATLTRTDAFFTMVRPGIALYGIPPAAGYLAFNGTVLYGQTAQREPWKRAVPKENSSRPTWSSAETGFHVPSMP